MKSSEKHYEVQQVAALTFAALVLYIPANILPIMTIVTWGQVRDMTIWQGVVALAQCNVWLIAIVVFLASIVVPFLKLIGLFFICISMLWRPIETKDLREDVWRWLDKIGRWSMLDVFLLTILVALLRLGELTSAYPGTGSGFFTAVVVLSMLATARAEKFVRPQSSFNETRSNA